ncbi:MAG: bifunctional riboflavin kinase/FAD synthetase [Bacteroidales bacterium]|nr:bifunctional riboflavin kinase/FAD synthetase [Bacteroidales bacterium]
MKIYHSIDLFQPVPNPVVSVGTFDGVHLGHQQIFTTMAEEARKCGGETVVVTFYPHPRLVIHPDSKNLRFINTQERKYEILSRCNIDHLVIIPFTREFSNLSGAEFVKRFLVDKIRTHKLIVGYDHHFGKDRLGGYNDLKGLGTIHGFEVLEVPARIIDGLPVSSTKIRNALNDGDISLANSLLGYYYSISGKVVHGKRIGRTIGFPTANIEIEDHYKLISAIGVYACKVDYHGISYKGMGNIGYRPTIDAGELTIEVNIFDFDEEIYGDRIIIYFIERIRDEVRFENLAALREQLIIDRGKVIEILR